MRVKKLSIRDITFTLPVILAVLYSKTVFWGIIYSDFLGYTFVALSFLCGIPYKIKKQKIENILAYIFPIAVWLIINHWVHWGATGIEGIMSVCRIIVLFGICGFITTYIPQQIFAQKYILFITICCLISLPCCLIANIAPDLAMRLCQRGYNYASRYGYTWYYTFGWYGTIFTRNAGPFWEPGAFQGFINVAILMLLYNVDGNQVKYRKQILLILFITLVTTQSTTGYILAIVIFITHYNDIQKFFTRKKFGFKQIAVFVMVFLFLYIILASGNIEDKLTGANGSHSAEGRFNDVASGILLIQQGGPFGFGLTEQKNIGKAMYNITDDSSGLTQLIYTFGWLFGITYICIAAKGIKDFFGSKKVLRTICISAVFLILFITEDLCLLPVYLLIILYGAQNGRHKFKSIPG